MLILTTYQNCFFSQLGTSNSWIDQGIFFQDGSVSEILIPDEFIPTDFQLYRDKKNQDKIWLVSGIYRDVTTYSHVWYKVDFEDFSDVKKSLFFEWKETLNGEGINCVVTYELAKEDRTFFEATEEEIEQRRKELFSNYERIDTFYLFSSFWREFEMEEQKENKINKALFYSFAKLYDTVKKENMQENSLQLPVHSVTNQNLDNDYQTAENPISLVGMVYEKYNERNEESVYVDCIQISRFFDQNIQSKINEELKDFTFSDWNGKEENNLGIYSQPSFISQNYFSVQK